MFVEEPDVLFTGTPTTRPWCQALVRNLDGHTQCLQLRAHPLSSPAEDELNVTKIQHRACGVRICDLVAAVAALPTQKAAAAMGSLFVSTGTRVLQADDAQSFLVADDATGLLPTCTAILRLRGGKGGFGSLLRGAAKSKNKTENNNACRDLSGRRLRHVNAESKMKDWRKEEEGRELERAAKEYIKKKEAQEKGDRQKEAEAALLAQASSHLVKNIAHSVHDGLQEARKLEVERLKRKAGNGGEAGPSSKRPVWGLPEDDDLSDSDEELEEKQPVSQDKPLATLKEAAVVSAAETETSHEPVEHAPIDLTTIPNAKALEKLGLERLKEELTRHGLKCGGTVQERAARLFLLSNTPKSQIDKKHFAKTSK